MSHKSDCQWENRYDYSNNKMGWRGEVLVFEPPYGRPYLQELVGDCEGCDWGGRAFELQYCPFCGGAWE
jgi:hypothetical protein